VLASTRGGKKVTKRIQTMSAEGGKRNLISEFRLKIVYLHVPHFEVHLLEVMANFLEEVCFHMTFYQTSIPQFDRISAYPNAQKDRVKA
jgi:hypothetical protein